METNVFADKLELARFFGNYIAELSKQQKPVNIALSGGSTPQSIFDVLAKEYAEKINWQSLRFFWSDERCVAPSHQDSNYRMAEQHLFSHIDVPEHNIFRIKGELSPEAACDDYIRTIKREVAMAEKWPVFDLMLLGMGDDGHTASIFPYQIKLWNSPQICVTGTHPISGQKRITLTGGVINSSKKIFFLVTGANKAEKVREIINKTGAYTDYPASKTDPAKTLWLLDKPAAQLLDV